MCDPAIAFGGERFGDSVGKWDHASGTITFSPPLASMDKDMAMRLANVVGFLYGPLRRRDEVLLHRVSELEARLAARQHIGTGAGMKVALREE